MNLRLLIFRYLRKHPTGTIAQIAKANNTSSQAIMYQLKALVESGIVLKQAEFYQLQPFLRAKDIDTKLYAVFTAAIQNHSPILSDDTIVDTSETISEGIAILCESFLEEIKQLLK